MTEPATDRLRAALAERYRIERELGRGGMATVYLAQDLKHDRAVALKVLRRELTTAVASERFLREIRIASRLVHPHIVPLLDSGEADGLLYFTMPFVEGETLRAKLVRTKQLRIDEALRIMSEVADALTYAHSQGVVHRDIKPENVLIAAEHAVVSDFGIARALTVAAGEELTATGLAIGTPAYMSPEQATDSGQVDSRSDVYSLGCVLYEMLIGHPPFVGATVREVLARHSLDPVPPLRTVRPDISEKVEHAVLKALSKTPAERFSSAATFTAALYGDYESAGFRRRAISQRMILAGVSVIALVLGAWFLLSERQSAAYWAPTHKRLTFTGRAYDPAISPDGKLFAYSSDSAVLIQNLTGEQPLILHPTKGTPLAWSPDGSELLFSTQRERSAAIFVVSALGGVPRQIWRDTTPMGGIPPAASWSPDGSRIAIACGSKVCLIDRRTSESVAIGQDSANPWRLVDLDWSVQTGRIAFVVLSRSMTTSGVSSALWTIAADGTKREKILEDSIPLMSPRWSPRADAIYYLRGGEERREIWRIALTSRTGRARSSPSGVASGLQPGVRFSLSGDGKRLLYGREVVYANLWLVQVPPRGGHRGVRTKQLTTGNLSTWGPSISPDGNRIAFAMGDSKKANVYTMSIGGDSLRQITFFDAFSSGPVWSPDGHRIAFGSTQGGEPDVWIVDADGGNLRRFARSELAHNFRGVGKFQLAWSPDSLILYQHDVRTAQFRTLDPKTGSERWLLQEDSVKGPMGSPRFSPTRRLLALRWARPHRGLWLVTPSTGTQTLLWDYDDWFDILGWSPDERWIYVLELNTGKPRLTRVPAQGGQPKELANLQFLPEPGIWGSMRPEGGRFVVEGWHSQSDVWVAENIDR